MAQYAISGFDRRSALSTRTYPYFSVLCLEDCFRSVAVEGTLSVGVGVPMQVQTASSTDGMHPGCWSSSCL
eukprot:8240299-Pyramimonas_sp.AAC.1